MLESVKQVLTKDIEASDIKRILETEIEVKMIDSVKDTLLKEIEVDDVKDFLEMEIELKKLKKLLLTEIKIKEFLLKEIRLKDLLPDIKVTIPADPKETEEAIEATPELAETEEEANTRCLSYDVSLVEQLRRDHEDLRFIYKEIIKSSKAEKFALVAVHVDTFTKLALRHYATADETLYPFLREHIVRQYPSHKKAVELLTLEMKDISVSIIYSLTQIAKIPVNEIIISCLTKEFVRIGEQLINRIDREERILFPLYIDGCVGCKDIAESTE